MRAPPDDLGLNSMGRGTGMLSAPAKPILATDSHFHRSVSELTCFLNDQIERRSWDALVDGLRKRGLNILLFQKYIDNEVRPIINLDADATTAKRLLEAGLSAENACSVDLVRRPRNSLLSFRFLRADGTATRYMELPFLADYIDDAQMANGFLRPRWLSTFCDWNALVERLVALGVPVNYNEADVPVERLCSAMFGICE